MTTKSAGKWNFPTFMKTSLATPISLEIDRSASSRVIKVGVSLGRESLFQTDNGIRFMLAPRSARAKHSSIPGKSHEIRNLSGSPSFSELLVMKSRQIWYLIFSLDNQRLDVFGAFVISRRHRVLCHLALTFYYFRKRRRGSRNHGSLYAFSLRVVIPFKSSFGLVTVLLGKVPEPEDEASQLAVEESRLDELELGNPGLDKLEASFNHD
nr:hypothetical protein [Tanacetum cinerariifolium]